MFTVTPAAAAELLAAAERSDAQGMALRVAARRTNDGDIEYGMGFDEPRVDDEAAQFAGLQVLIGSPSRALLSDTQLDYVEVEPGRFEFVFADANPAAPPQPGAGACGSGGCSRCSN